MKDIVLTTINAKWTHPSLALRLLKANLGSLEPQCEIIEFALRQPLREKTEPILVIRPRILGVSVSIWNHLATIELFEALEKEWSAHGKRPIIVLGGPEISYLSDDAKIFEYADYIIRGEGETVFSALCKSILQNENKMIGGCTQSLDGDIWLDRQCSHAKACVNSCQPSGASRALRTPTKELIFNMTDNLAEIKTAYHLYTDEDIAQKLIYVESTRGCPFECEFCLSAVKSEGQSSA